MSSNHLSFNSVFPNSCPLIIYFPGQSKTCYNASEKDKSLMSEFHEIFCLTSAEKQLEMTLRIPLIPPTTQPKNS